MMIIFISKKEVFNEKNYKKQKQEVASYNE